MMSWGRPASTTGVRLDWCLFSGMDAAVKIPQSAGFDAFEQMLHGYSAVYSTILTGMATLARSHFQLSTVVGTGIISIQSVGQGRRRGRTRCTRPR